MENSYLIASVFLTIFTIIAGLDGFYLHLWKFQLHKKEGSKFEHKLHTANAILFPATIFFLFLCAPTGVYLWLSLFLTVLTYAIETIDVGTEKQSRLSMGGLTSFEAQLHFLMGILRAVFTAIIFSTSRIENWTHFFNSELNMFTQFSHPSELVFYLGWSVIGSGILAAVLHLVLCFKTEVKAKFSNNILMSEYKGS